ncbi:MAG TPA: GPP34 family phosphoprotein [Bacteroidales bacterium]|nr:GPP34 family phosphoprotein [Bacteroidales bacterium]
MKLTTTEKFLLIAHHPEKGRFKLTGVHLQYGTIGALLMDLSLAGRVLLEQDRLALQPKEQGDDPVAEEIAMRIRGEIRPRKIRYWISRLARRARKYRWMILEGLAARSVVRIEQRRFLGLIPYRKSYLTDSYRRSELIRQLREDILFQHEVDDEIIALAGMIQACTMYRFLSPDREERKKLKTGIRRMVETSPMEGIVAQTSRQIQAAIMAAIVASTAASSSAAGSH